MLGSRESSNGITDRDTFALVTAVRQEHGVYGGHHRDSMNTFYEAGLNQIFTSLFHIEGTIKNKRTKTAEDLTFSEVKYSVEFNTIRVKEPMYLPPDKKTPEILLPNTARLYDQTYAGEIMANAEIKAWTIPNTGHNSMVKTETINNIVIGEYPIMVRSKRCWTYGAPKEILRNFHENPDDRGGFFIINGKEWGVDVLENVANNSLQVYKNAYKDERCRGTFLSKQGDDFENSYQTILRYLKDGQITIEITSANKAETLKIPFFLIFKIAGMTSDREICEQIVYDVDSKDHVTQQILERLYKAFYADNSTYAPILRSSDRATITNFIANMINENIKSATDDPDVQRYVNTGVIALIDRSLFPHVGQKNNQEAYRIEKMRFLGQLIRELILVDMEVLGNTDRDSYKNKRLHAAGISLPKSTKTHFNLLVVNEIKRMMRSQFDQVSFSQVNLSEIVKNAIKPADFRKATTSSIVNSTGIIKIKNNPVQNRVQAQTIYRKNQLNYMATLGTVVAPDQGTNKSNARAREMRSVHPSYIGYIDVTASTDSGEKVGITKQIASTAQITGSSKSELIKQKLLSDDQVMRLDAVEPRDILHNNLTCIYVNGHWIGCCQNGHLLAAKYRDLRRKGEIHHHVSIVWELLVRKVSFWCDYGRVVRPLIIVRNNIEEYKAAQKAGNDVAFRQWIDFTPEIANDLRKGKLTIDDLRERQIIEYISAEEQENLLLASHFSKVDANHNNPLVQYTHCDIPLAVFGVATLSAALMNHSQSSRMTMFGNHRKQCCTIYDIAYPFRCDKNVFVQDYNHIPLIRGWDDNPNGHNGQNIVCSMQMYTGDNVEDSLKINRSSRDLGMFTGSFYTYEHTRLEKGESFDTPNAEQTADRKEGAVYANLDRGIVKVGTILTKNQVIFAKVAKLAVKKDNFAYVDKSIVYKNDIPAYVEAVYRGHTPDEFEFAKVKIRMVYNITIGDKNSSETGNKGIVGAMCCRSDMPFSYEQHGLIPDVICNPCSIPTRMATNQICEIALGNLATSEGGIINAISFTDMNLIEVIDRIHKSNHPVKNGAEVVMYNGQWGCRINNVIFCGVCSYQRLQKHIYLEHYCTGTGPTSATTRQPTAGRANDGGLKIGEMEKDAMASQGTMAVMYSKMLEDSDKITLYTCRCGLPAIVNEESNIYTCKQCGDNAQINKVTSSWAFNKIYNLTLAMGVDARFHLQSGGFVSNKN